MILQGVSPPSAESDTYHYARYHFMVASCNQANVLFKK
jgi:hypothetical protein